ncbi:MAG: DUF1080 domain-containing protein, partial [Phycisphaerae bacterium]|nr:DUF1080 domain-containing protein [Phycisphaerae bacterium]
ARLTVGNGAGLAARGGPVRGFTIAGEDGAFGPAEAVIEGETITVRSARVARPSAVRYNWAAVPEGNVFNGAGLPMLAYRSDDWARERAKADEEAWMASYRGTDAGFTPLFNGRDLGGWVNINCAPGTWGVDAGRPGGAVITCTGKPTGLLRTERMYENYVLELEWRHLEAQGNAGLFIWSDALTARGQPFTRAVEVQVMVGSEGDWYTSDGDIFPIHGAVMTPETGRGKGSRAFPTLRRTNPAPMWNHYRVECIDGRVTLAVNGKVVSAGRDASPRRGYICLESEGTAVEFRNIRIKELPAAQPALAAKDVAAEAQGFEPLYSGVDFSGWKHGPEHAGHWVSKDWTIAFDGKGPDLWTERSFKDFELVCDWRWTAAPKEQQRPVILPTGEVKRDGNGKEVTVAVPDAGDSGIYLRGSSKSQVNMWCWPVGSGEVYGYRTDPNMPAAVKAAVTPKKAADTPIGQWNRFVITMKGDRLTVVLNGETVIENAHLPGVAAEGPIALQSHGDPIEFANIFVRELK